MVGINGHKVVLVIPSFELMWYKNILMNNEILWIFLN